MYIVVHGHDNGMEVSVPRDSRGNIMAMFRKVNTIEEARDLRAVSGDLVFCDHNLKIVESTDWLFEWELNKEDCYARKHQRAKTILKII